MKFVATFFLVLAAATRTAGHCWPCDGEGNSKFDNNVGECIQCCEDMKFDGYKSDDGSPPFDDIRDHREHCKQKHCQAWAKETRGGNCEITVEGQDTGWCPEDHRNCDEISDNPKSPCGLVYADAATWPEGYTCRKSPCTKKCP